MRVEKEYSYPSMKATIFSWNNKFLMKFEQGDLEQTYKVSELDYMLDEVEELMTDDFISSVQETFKIMSKNLYSRGK